MCPPSEMAGGAVALSSFDLKTSGQWCEQFKGNIFLIQLVLQVRGVKGVFLANQKIDGKVTTVITYNKGRDWEPLAPPTTDMNGKPVSCKAVSIASQFELGFFSSCTDTLNFK